MWRWKARSMWLWGILLVAFLLRLIGTPTAVPLVKDPAEYRSLAGHLLEGGGFSTDGRTPTAFRPPGYPVFLAGVLGLSGGRLVVVRLMECLLGVLTCGLLFRLGRHVAGPAVGLTAAAWWAVNPLAFDSYFAAGTINSETVCSFLILGSAFLLWRSFETPSGRLALAAGLALGVSILTKSALLPLPMFLLPLWVFRSWRQRSLRPVLLGAVTALGCALCVLPWTARNWCVFGTPVLVSTNGGITFYRSNNPVSDGGHTYPVGGLDRFSELDEVQRSSRFHQEGLAFLRAHPEKIPWLAYRKTRLLLDPFYGSTLNGGATTVNFWLLIGLPLGLVGLVASARVAPWWTSISLSFLLALLFVTVLYHGYDRYRFPYEPFLALWAAFGVQALLRRLSSCRGYVSASCAIVPPKVHEAPRQPTVGRRQPWLLSR